MLRPRRRLCPSSLAHPIQHVQKCKPPRTPLHRREAGGRNPVRLLVWATSHRNPVRALVRVIIPKIRLDFLDRGDRPKNKKCPYREQEGAPCTGLIARATRERYAQTHAGCAVPRGLPSRKGKFRHPPVHSLRLGLVRPMCLRDGGNDAVLLVRGRGPSASPAAAHVHVHVERLQGWAGAAAAGVGGRGLSVVNGAPARRMESTPARAKPGRYCSVLGGDACCGGYSSSTARW